jgi:hypothetical protein
MNTAVVLYEPKKVVSVEILHLDELGYGPQGKHTRREWRAECLKFLTPIEGEYNLLRDNLNQKSRSFEKVSFQYSTVDEAGNKVERLNASSDLQDPCSFDFIGLEFDIPIAFMTGRAFYQSVFFHHAVFKQFIYLSEIQCVQDLVFSGAKFLGNVTFQSINVQGFTFFEDAYFHKFADFSKAEFSKFATFSRVKFKAASTFFGSIFKSHAEFNLAEFEYHANFSDVEFNAFASFNSACFNSQASFSRAKFKILCSFNNGFDTYQNTWSKETEFNAGVNFENVEIHNVGHFERVQFNGEIPNFLGVDNSKTLLIFSGDEYFNKNDTSEDAVKRIAQLKRLADEQGQSDQALMFNAFELNAKAQQPNAGIALKTITGLYEILSDYGRSFIRPIIFYLILIWLGFLYSFGYSVNLAEISEIHKNNCKSAATEQKLDLSRERAAVEYAMFRAGGVFDFTNTGKQNNAVNCRLFEEPIEPPLMRAWGIFKGIASIALLFLAALGLRNKYRIK